MPRFPAKYPRSLKSGVGQAGGSGVSPSVEQGSAKIAPQAEKPFELGKQQVMLETPEENHVGLWVNREPAK